jgi:hypothetical protein
MPSNEVYYKLLAKGLTIDKGGGTRYNKNDTLASANDLIDLFETLDSVKDKCNHAVKITAISLT